MQAALAIFARSFSTVHSTNLGGKLRWAKAALDFVARAESAAQNIGASPDASPTIWRNAVAGRLGASTCLTCVKTEWLPPIPAGAPRVGAHQVSLKARGSRATVCCKGNTAALIQDPTAAPGGSPAIGCLGGAAIRRLISIGEPRRATFRLDPSCKTPSHVCYVLPLRFPVASVCPFHDRNLDGNVGSWRATKRATEGQGFCPR